METTERVVIGVLVGQSLVLLFLFVYIIAAKVREALGERRRVYLAKTVGPLVEKLCVSVIAGEDPAVSIADLRQLVRNPMAGDTIAEMLINRIELVAGETRARLCALSEELGLVDMELRRLKRRDPFAKALACKRLGGYRSRRAASEVFAALDVPMVDVKYHGLLTLAKIGDLSFFRRAFKEKRSVVLLSERSLIEIIDSFEGDKVALYREMMYYEDEFVSSLFIKSAGNVRCQELADEISAFLASDSFTRRIAALKALGHISDARFVKDIRKALADPDWRIRAIAAKSLGLMGDVESKDVLREALSDPEWWVRHNAAEALVKLGVAEQVLKEIEKSNDRFAIESLRYALEAGSKRARTPAQVKVAVTSQL